jgi:hypothetical protein
MPHPAEMHVDGLEQHSIVTRFSNITHSADDRFLVDLGAGRQPSRPKKAPGISTTQTGITRQNASFSSK